MHWEQTFTAWVHATVGVDEAFVWISKVRGRHSDIRTFMEILTYAFADLVSRQITHSRPARGGGPSDLVMVLAMGRVDDVSARLAASIATLLALRASSSEGWALKRTLRREVAGSNTGAGMGFGTR